MEDRPLSTQISSNAGCSVGPKSTSHNQLHTYSSAMARFSLALLFSAPSALSAPPRQTLFRALQTASLCTRAIDAETRRARRTRREARREERDSARSIQRSWKLRGTLAWLFSATSAFSAPPRHALFRPLQTASLCTRAIGAETRRARRTREKRGEKSERTVRGKEGQSKAQRVMLSVSSVLTRNIELAERG
jgi:hypothetical protein